MKALTKFNLSEDQKTFLGTYCALDSRVEEALNTLHLDRSHYDEWLMQPDFQLAYRYINRTKKEFLNAENDLLARQNINAQLRAGHLVKTTSVRKVKGVFNPDTKCIEEVEELEAKTERIPLPPALLKLAMQQTTLEQAISKLAADGMLSQEQYHQIINLAEEYENKASEVIDINAIKEDANNSESDLDKAQRWLEATLVGIIEKVKE